jgi:hypothetical protein
MRLPDHRAVCTPPGMKMAGASLIPMESSLATNWGRSPAAWSEPVIGPFAVGFVSLKRKISCMRGDTSRFYSG